jgi:hypothetical protein
MSALSVLSKEQLITLAETHKIFNSTMHLNWSFKKYIDYVIQQAVEQEQEIAANTQKVQTEVIEAYLNGGACHVH